MNPFPDRASWLEIWRTMLKTEHLLGVVMARALASSNNKVFLRANRVASVVLAQRQLFEYSWKWSWGNLTDFRLWAMD